MEGNGTAGFGDPAMYTARSCRTPTSAGRKSTASWNSATAWSYSWWFACMQRKAVARTAANYHIVVLGYSAHRATAQVGVGNLSASDHQSRV